MNNHYAQVVNAMKLARLNTDTDNNLRSEKRKLAFNEYVKKETQSPALKLAIR